MSSWPRSELPSIMMLLDSSRRNHNEIFKEDSGSGAIAKGSSNSFCQGSFAASPDFQVDGELLEAAISRVNELVMVFPSRQNSDVELVPLPSWMFRLVNIRRLNIVSYPHTTLPETIGCLTNLTHLEMYRSALNCLPRSIGQLKNLEFLNIYCSYHLHFLPIEVLRCQKLADSLFSTRALFANYKNKLPLPPLLPWWQAKVQAAPSFDATCNLLYKVHFGENSSQSLPLAIIRHHILTFLPWNWCSVCGTKYAHDLGCHAWARQRVATDVQALLAFCCSVDCAGQIRNQMYFDPQACANSELRLNQDLQNTTTCESSMPENIPEIWRNASKFPSKGRGDLGTYEDWAKEHLKPWPPNMPPPKDGDDSLVTPKTRAVGCSIN